MEEFLKSLKAWLYDRTSNPLFFVFVLSWIFWNFRLFVVAFSDGELSLKLEIINQLYSDPDKNWCEMLILPGVTTLITIVVYPILSNLTFILHKWYENCFAEWKLRLENRQAVDREQYRLLRSELVALQEGAAEMEGKKDTEISELRKIIGMLRSQIPASQKIYPHQDLGDLEKSILLNFKDQFDIGIINIPKEGATKKLAQEMGKTPTEMDVAIKRLVQHQLLKMVGNDLSGFEYLLTDDGKEYSLKLSGEKGSLEGQDKLRASSAIVTSDELNRRNGEKWRSEFASLVPIELEQYREALRECLHKIAAPDLNADYTKIAFALGKGLVERKSKDELALTGKGQYFAANVL
jgi:hypothetical protein